MAYLLGTGSSESATWKHLAEVKHFIRVTTSETTPPSQTCALRQPVNSQSAKTAYYIHSHTAMSVELVPAELGFKRKVLRTHTSRPVADRYRYAVGPFVHEVSQTLRLHNPTNDPIAFKVKTTAPKQYVPSKA